VFELREGYLSLLLLEPIPSDSVRVWILDGDNAMVHKYLGTLAWVEFRETVLWNWRKQESPENSEKVMLH
jgi:hypothetical protein